MLWNDWLDEDVEWDRSEYVTRRKAIHTLCTYGLIPLLKSYGYTLALTNKDLGSRIATGLYKNERKSYVEANWGFGSVENEYMTEDYTIQFNHDINTEVWDRFWAIWGVWHDLDASTEYGRFRQQEIREYLWSQVDGERSEAILRLKELNEDDEYETELDSGDAYLKDSRESNEWGGLRK